MVSDPRNTKITIFGAGIAGLSAAHELALRGFKVEVIAPELNLELRGDTLDRGLGGMARSQFVCDVSMADNPSGMQRWISTANFLVDDTIVFLPQTDAQPAEARRAAQLLDRAADAIRWLLANTDEPYSFSIDVPGNKSRPRFDVPFIPDAPRPSVAARIAWMTAELSRRLGSLVAERDLAAFFNEATVLNASDDPRLWVSFSVGFEMAPAEHGFRFFPSFYRHLFDTMKRTQIVTPRDFEAGRSTVFDNLVATDGLGLARAAPARSFVIPRSPPIAFETLRKYLDLALTELDYTVEDIARYQLKLFKYMTSCRERRVTQYENMSWGEFVEVQRFSPVCRRHVEFGPQMTAALRGSLSDTRTQGTITVQLLLDQLRTSSHVDSTLDGPTSGMWLDHWHEFLAVQNVRFRRGRLTDFVARAGKVVPVLESPTLDDTKTVEVNADYFIFALSLPELYALAPRFLAAASATGQPLPADNDFDRVRGFVERDLAGDTLAKDLQRDEPRGPLQHLSGIQFYFATDIRFWRGHTQYLDAPWGLTSISQPQFWLRARTPRDLYRSVLSVDIGIWNQKYRGLTAWECKPDQLAQYTWEQIRDHHLTAFRAQYGEQADLPHPVAYALDNDLVLGGQDDTRQDTTPFLVNRTGAYPRRPGRLHPAGGDHAGMPRYPIWASQYVIAGTFAQTYTRLTSMEGANESARHAVNAVIAAANAQCEPCEIWDPEACELPDLTWLIELDRKLLQRRLPHFTDILGWRELPAQIMPHHVAHLLERGMR